MGISRMRPRINRSFQVTDAIVLVAATGFGLAGCRFWLWASKTSWGDYWPPMNEPTPIGLWMAALGAIPVASIPLFSWTMAVLMLRLRGTRPRRRHLWCQPGFLACVAAFFLFTWKCFIVVLIVAEEALEALWVSPAQLLKLSYGDLFSELALMQFGSNFVPQVNVGTAVLLLWLVAWASGRFRPEPGWVDRSGRVLGAVWIGISLLEVFAPVLG
jgi:hypothetical protein